MAIVYQVVFHYRIPFYERIFSDPELRSHLYYGKDNPYNKNKSYDAEYNFSSMKLRTMFIPFGTESTGTRKVMPFFPSLFFRLIAFSPDIILCEGTSALPNAIVSYIYSKLFRKPLIWWSLGSINEDKKLHGLRSRIEVIIKYLELHSSAVFTYSTPGKNYFIRKGIAPNKIFVGVNVIDTNKRLKEIEIVQNNIVKDNNIFQILFVGAVIKEKRLEVLIDAFNLLHQKYEDKVKLMIVGDGSYLDDIKEYSKKKGTQNIFFAGKVIEGISRYFLESDIFVLPGLGGLAISDAMIHGLPVITSIADGTEKDLVTEETGIIIDNLTSEALFEKLDLLYLNPDKKEMLSVASKKAITTLFSFDNYYSNFKKTVGFVLNKKI